MVCQKSIVSDRDKTFTSNFWQHLFKCQGTTLAMSTAYHPQTDGQSEALNHCIEMYLRCFVFDRPCGWIQFLPWAEFWYNIAYQTSVGMTPFHIVYGRLPPSLIRDSAIFVVPEVDQLLQRDVILHTLKHNLLVLRIA